MGHKHATMPQETNYSPTPTPASKPPVNTPQSVTAPQAPPMPTANTPAGSPVGNGMVWCSGPQAPGWNVNLPDGGCSPQKPLTSTGTVVQLSQLPYTGDSPIDVSLNIGFYLVVTFGAIFGIGRIIKSLYAKNAS